MTLQLDRLDHLGASAFEGFIVRKDLVRRYAKAYPGASLCCRISAWSLLRIH